MSEYSELDGRMLTKTRGFSNLKSCYQTILNGNFIYIAATAQISDNASRLPFKSSKSQQVFMPRHLKKRTPYRRAIAAMLRMSVALISLTTFSYSTNGQEL